MSDLKDASHSLERALEIRCRYMQMSMQSFSFTARRFVYGKNKALDTGMQTDFKTPAAKRAFEVRQDSGWTCSHMRSVIELF